MRMCGWSSDVCSSDLRRPQGGRADGWHGEESRTRCADGIGPACPQARAWTPYRDRPSALARPREQRRHRDGPRYRHEQIGDRIMDSQLPSTPETDPAVRAFAQLGAKVDLLEAAVTGLTAKRDAMPDYSQTLGEISALLEEMDAAIHDFARSPAMTLTPDDMAAQIAAAGPKARAPARDRTSDA